jgi:Fe(3+) dicitrate transport protein
VGTTDSSGRLTFEGLAPGEYALEALAPSFSLRAAQVVLTGGEARLIDLTLAPGTFTETVTVIATHLGGRPETLARIPGSIEIIDPLMLTASRPFNFSEALRKGSGINVRDEEGLGLRPNIGIRGLSPTRSTKVLLLEDGIPVTYAPYGDNVSYYHPPLERFEAVEILKGSGKSPTDR